LSSGTGRDLEFSHGGSNERVPRPAFATFVLANTDPQRWERTFGSIVWAFDTGIGTGSRAV
jgi:hypothetical protein